MPNLKISFFIVLAFGLEPLYAVSTNQSAPAFSLQNSRGQRRSLSMARGHVTFVDFWASWCAPCRLELPEVDRLAKEMGSRVRVYAINVDKNQADGKALLAKLGLTAAHFDVLWDTSNKTVSRYNIEAMPTSLVIDSKGIVRSVYSGFHPKDPEAWRRTIAALTSKT